MSVAVVGVGPEADAIRWGLEHAIQQRCCPPEYADQVFVVGTSPAPVRHDNQRFVHVLLPNQKPSSIRAALGSPRDRWLAPTEADGARLLDIAGSVNASVDIRVLRWSCAGEISRTPAHPARVRPLVYVGRSMQKVPLRLADTTRAAELADLVVQPDGLMGLLEAQHRGVPVILEEGDLLCEYLEPGVDGVVAPRGEMERTIIETLRRGLRAMTVPQPGRLVARREAFVRTLGDVATGRRLSVVFVHGRKPDITPWQKQPIGARGIRYQALISFGAQVHHVPDLAGLHKTRHDFVMLGGRVPVERVKAISAATKAPIVMAMNDGIIDMPEREAWYAEVTKYVALMFVGEPPELLRANPHCKVYQLHQAPLTLWGSKRGTVRAPFERMPPDPELGVVFLANQWYSRRVDLVRRFAAAGPELHCIGQRPPPVERMRHSPRVCGAVYGSTMQRAVAVLSTSICNDRNATSCRLFEACSVGAYVLAEAFPGCRDIYPDDCVAWWDTPEEAAELAVEAMCEPQSARITEMRWRAQERTWRCFSAHDRMEYILETVRRELGVW